MNHTLLTPRRSVTQQIGKWILIAATVALVVCGLLMFARLGASVWLYAAIEDWVTTRLGFDYYLAQFAATTATVGATFVLPAFAWYVFTGRKKLWGAFVPIGGWALIYLLVSTVGAQVCFDRRTGQPLCYYADTGRGRVWSRTHGYDPASGERFKLYTREIYQRETAASRPTATPATNSTPPAANNNQTKNDSRTAPPSAITPPRPRASVIESHVAPVGTSASRADSNGGGNRQVLNTEQARGENYAREAESRSTLEQPTTSPPQSVDRETERREAVRRDEDARRAAAQAEREREEWRRDEARQREHAEREREKQRRISRVIEFGIGQLERRFPRRY